MRVIEENEWVERIFVDWRLPLGKNYDAYKGHVYRMMNFTCALIEGKESDLGAYGRPQDVEARIAIAGCFHDADFALEANGDYLEPSRERANAWLQEQGRSEWAEEIGLMIVWHHKLTPYKGEHAALVEPFRQADLIDLSLGLVPCGLPGSYIRDVKRRFPNAGFHALLAKNLVPYALKHPLKPMPMMRR
jgi:hypothetical protein